MQKLQKNCSFRCRVQNLCKVNTEKITEDKVMGEYQGSVNCGKLTVNTLKEFEGTTNERQRLYYL